MTTAILKRVSTLAIAAAIAGSFMMTAPQAKAEDAQISDAKISDDDRAKIEQVVKELLNREPEIILDAVDNYQARKAREQAEKAKQAIEKHNDFFKSADVPSIGNPDGDITMVEFFDYHCGYCKRALPDVTTLHKNDPDVHIVFVEFPILSPESELAAKAALGAHQQDKYFAFHQALMETRGKLDEDKIMELAEETGLDTDALAEYIASDDAAAAINKNKQLARSIGVTGTPAFLINDNFMPGAVGLARMTEVIKKEREQAEGTE